jgi:hypothetical protein
VASFYLDNNLPSSLALALRNLGHSAVHVRDLGYRHAKDFEHLMFAAQLGATLLTHDRDYELLHGAWRFWTATWGLPHQHGGILILPDYWLTPQAASEVHGFVQHHGSLINTAYQWQPPGRWSIL